MLERPKHCWSSGTDLMSRTCSVASPPSPQVVNSLAVTIQAMADRPAGHGLSLRQFTDLSLFLFKKTPLPKQERLKLHFQCYHKVRCVHQVSMVDRAHSQASHLFRAACSLT